VIIAYLYMLLLKQLAGIMIYLSIGLTEIILIVGGFYSYYYARPQYEKDDPTYDYLAYTAYVVWGIAGILGLCVLCCLKSIALGVAVFQTTVEYVKSNWMVFFLPAAASLLSFIWITIWLSAAIFIFSVGTPEAREGFPYFTEIKWSDQTRYIMIYHVFAYLWISAFIIGMTQFIIGASTVIWYFDCRGDSYGKGSLYTAFSWGAKWHWSSVALGSLIIAICQMIRLAFEYYRKKMAAVENANGLVKFLMCATGYCLWCLEKCVKYISKNAYIQVALNNCNFLTGAINAFVLILRNAADFGWTNTIGTVYMFFGAFFITATSCFGTYVFLVSYDGLQISSPIPTTVVMGFIAVMLSYQFLSIFSFSSDAILQAYHTDMTVTKGKGN